MKQSKRGDEKYSGGRKVGPQQRAELTLMGARMGITVPQNRETRRLLKKAAKKATP